MHRPRWRYPRALLVLLVAVGAVVAAPISANALGSATPTPSPTPLPSGVIGEASYTGDEHIVARHADGTVSRDLTQKATVHVLCTAPGRCTMQAFGGTTTLRHGVGSLKIAEKGDRCAISASGWNPEGTISVEATETRMLVTLHQVGVPTFTCASGEISIDSQDVTFTATASGGTPCVVAGTCPLASPAAGPGSAASAGGPRTGATPSVLSALPTASMAITPRNAIWAAAAAVILVLLIALPTQLFNSASEMAGERIGAWWHRVRPRTRASAAIAATTKQPVAWSGWLPAAAGVLAASVISAFVDPALNFDAAGLRTLLSILVSFLLDVVVGWFVLLVIVRRTHPQAIATFEFKPLTLVVVAVAVLLSRITGFQPGIVFGLVAGIVFGGVIGTAKARVALMGLAYSFAVGILAWIGYSLVASAAGTRPGPVFVFVEETLSSAAIAGIAALPIALLPIGALVGREVWRWNRLVWAVAYGIGLVGFFLVLMPMPIAWAEVPLSLWTWIALYLAYAVVAVVIWSIVTRPWRRTPASGDLPA